MKSYILPPLKLSASLYGGVTIFCEGHGSGEGRGASPGEVHEIALKEAETDATKRALATFGRPFGLELYRGGKTAFPKPLPSATVSVRDDTRTGFHPDDRSCHESHSNCGIHDSVFSTRRSPPISVLPGLRVMGLSRIALTRARSHKFSVVGAARWMSASLRKRPN